MSGQFPVGPNPSGGLIPLRAAFPGRPCAAALPPKNAVGLPFPDAGFGGNGRSRGLSAVSAVVSRWRQGLQGAPCCAPLAAEAVPAACPRPAERR